MTKSTRSISVKFSLIFGAVLAVAIVVITLFATWKVRHLAVDSFNAASMGQIRQIDANLKDTFGQIRNNVVFIANSPVVQTANDSIANYVAHGGVMAPDTNGGVESEIFSLLKRFGDSHPELRYVYLGTKWGGYVQWPKGEFKAAYDPRVRPWYEKGLRTPREVGRTSPYTSAEGNRDEVDISFVRTFDDAQGKPLGVVGMDISLAGLTQMVSQVRFGETGYLMIADEGGIVLVDPHDRAHGFKPLQDLGDGYRDLAALANGTLVIDLNGTRYDSVVYTSPDLGWKYIGLIPHAEMMAVANRMTIVLTLGGALLLVAAIALTIVLGRRMTGPLRQLSDGMRDIASGDGDLTQRLPVTSGDEVGTLAGQFNAFAEKLNRLLLDIRASSETLLGATGEIAAGNADLSSRTEQQAAALEETAASMEQLTSAVKNNADNARHANALATEATDVARRSSEVVQRVVNTMSEINVSSSRIAEITTLIEDIAFQTNILALNAAVEAARAGEEGRGFAVVAGEVRNLAQRSSAAAKDIKDLIGASVGKIQQGSMLASEAGQTMSEVTQAVGRFADIMGEIATASDEQSRGIEQVNLAIAQMDDVTQQNAALVEEAAAASSSLEDQGRQLNRVVAVFRLQ
ncbi:methyl-accepting chemotaxis protein [Burkholderia multivorans]|uniref:Methyl-accepting chemotaxis protein II (MCP-II) (Aspartatechemoreceptor protein) n=1 Tax=Burkholderia multivorans CGD2 TaxID=513052 RepID=B9BUS1_9BURK|nr:methyl-accepting chemotaxis protein [Burkholderia multivorans]EEE05568.1 methyl-accepting chemotaxis protein II (MCP-II) (Aspartatechemoreceptor protein) [Burkholderia multivorans CGD2]EEE11841.1 methyl-accepting chemotaxis protein II (MCP-II) (Aspartatechemoreceptor protein) [Burkholderia multivorans CGD2M]